MRAAGQKRWYLYTLQIVVLRGSTAWTITTCQVLFVLRSFHVVAHLVPTYPHFTDDETEVEGPRN